MLKTLQFLTLSLLLALSACSSISTNGKAKSFKAKQIPSAFKNSYKNWQQLKDKHNANYSYERDSLSPEGFHSSTKITVIDDQVEFRDFFEWQQGNTPTLTWTEDFAQLGTHDQGASVKTVDQLYQQCKNQILSQPQTDFAITFKVDQINILQQCSYTRLSCTSQCTKGIRIQGLSLK